MVVKLTRDKGRKRRPYCYEPNSEGSGSAWMAYMDARIAGLFLLDYPNSKGVVHAMSRGLDMASHWLGVGAAPLMSPRQDETSEPLLYAGGMAGPYRCKDITRGQNDDPVTSGIRAKSDRTRIFTISHSMEARRRNGLIQMVDDSRCTRNKAKPFEGCRSSVRMTMHEVVHEMVVGECHEPNSKGSGSACMAYMDARIAGLFMLVLLEYPNSKGVVRATSRGLDMAPHWSGVQAAPLMSPKQVETSEPLLYAGWMVGLYRCKDATRGQNDDPVTSGIKAKSDRSRIVQVVLPKSS
ncbi:hypothetical protein Tco_0940460 [Tanacetum coccineum]|uniref:Uncharacterized protein n=1 Tax=Tanacetum coccineum TaxID=301880 RepID=A0ABQ5DN33_9ASTR